MSQPVTQIDPQPPTQPEQPSPQTQPSPPTQPCPQPLKIPSPNPPQIPCQQQQIPDKFYDSDLASINQKDFLSDNEPPKDIIQQRKLLHKQKSLHIFKTIMRVGTGIDKPAPFDQIKLRFRMHVTPGNNKQAVDQAKIPGFVEGQRFLVYNLGKKFGEIEKLVISMKRGEIALFQLQEIQVSKKSNIKVLKTRTVYVIHVQNWVTAIDIDENKQVLKYVLKRGDGAFRVNKYDQLTYSLSISYKNQIILNEQHNNIKIQQQTISNMQPLTWKMLTTMKRYEIAEVKLNQQNLWLCCGGSNESEDVEKEKEGNQKYMELMKLKMKASQSSESNKQVKEEISEITEKQEKVEENTKGDNFEEDDRVWKFRIEIKELANIDDVFLDGSILKKLLIKGVSTAKPESSSFIYYALKFLGPNKQDLHQDPCFNSDWWQDYGKLEELGCRKNYLDEYKVSKLLKCAMKRMKPAEVSEIECRTMDLFKYGQDFQDLQKLWPKDQQFPPSRVTMIVRVYNFTEGKNCFNMTIDEKVEESKRKKIVAVKLLNQGKLQKALKKFESIVSFYNSGDINQAAYDQKVSSLMNSILCLMKQNKYSKMIPLCNSVLQRPKHGFNQDKMQLNAQGIKVEGNTDNVEKEKLDSREAADLQQNAKILDKCLYRKAFALVKIGESQQAIEALDRIVDQSEEVGNLRKQAERNVQNYQQKSKKIFQSMFG